MLILKLILIFVGLIAPTAFLFLPAYRYLSAANWERVDCDILDSGVVNASSDTVELRRIGVGDDKTIIQQSRHSNYQTCRLRFDFMLNGTRHTGDRISFATDAAADKWAIDLLHQFPIGSKTYCFVNPTDPDQSVFRQRMGTRAWIVGAVSCLTLPLTYVGLFGLFRRRNRPMNDEAESR